LLDPQMVLVTIHIIIINLLKYMKRVIGFAMFLVVAFGSFAFTNTAEANHSWSGYHWARISNPFTLKLGDNVSGVWDSILITTSNDWTTSSVLDTTIVSGLGGKNCKATLGRVEVCNSKYGRNGWLGIASVWASSGHITQGTVKVNDTYFNTTTYNTVAWRNLVMCQEVGHTFGLDHQDEVFANANLDTCMDYTNTPGTNQHPNAHDYEQLEAIYAHLDGTTTVSQMISPKNLGSEVSELSSSWGTVVRKDGSGRNSVFERDLGNGNKVITHVFWAE
jgi:hypothetical protein